MSDAENAALQPGGADGAENPTPANDNGAGSNSEGTANDNGALSALADEGAAAAAAAGPATWPDDWREKLTNGDDAGMALLKRIGSVDDLYKKVLSQEQVIRRGAHKIAPTLPENATEEQVAEYRKALGVPEAPDGYGLKFAEELRPTEADTELLNGFLAEMHNRHMPAAYAKATFDWYQSQMARAREAAVAEAQRARHANEQTLRKEYGADYIRNLRLADEFLDGYPGLKRLVSPHSDTELLRDIIAIARETADEEALFSGDGRGGGKSLDEEYNDLIRKSVTTKMSDTDQQRLLRLAEARVARDEKRSRAA